MLSPERKRLRTDQRFCPHCSKLLSYKTFRAHKRLYYDEVKDHWYKVLHDDGDEIQCNSEDRPLSSLECDSSPCLSGDDSMEYPQDEREESSPDHSDAALSDPEG